MIQGVKAGYQPQAPDTCADKAIATSWSIGTFSLIEDGFQYCSVKKIR